MCEYLDSIGSNSRKIVLDTLQFVKIKSRETSKQGITVSKSATQLLQLYHSIQVGLITVTVALLWKSTLKNQ